MKHYAKGPVSKKSKKSSESKPTDIPEDDWDNLQESEYVKEKQIFLYIRGINTKNYPALTENLASNLKDLAFAKLAFEKMNRSLANQYKLFQKNELI